MGLLLFLSFGVLCASAQDSNKAKADHFILEGHRQMLLGNNSDAFEMFRHGLMLNPKSSVALSELSHFWQYLRQDSLSLQYMKLATQYAPDNYWNKEALVDFYVDAGKTDEAIEVLEQLSKQFPNKEDVLLMLETLYKQKQDYANAISTLTRLETIEGKNERLSYAKSKFYTQMGNKKAAIAEMKTLADQYPNDNNYRSLYANTLYVNGQQKKALAIYDKILKEEPDNRNAQMAMLAHYNEQEDSVRAYQMMERILVNKNATTEDRVALMRQAIGESEQNGGDSTRVLQLFHLVLDMPDLDADMALFCATYMNLKKMPTDSICQVLERALEVAPDNAAARLQLVSYAWQAEDRDRVIALCRDARQYNPDEMAFYYYQGIAYYQKDQLDEALNAFQNGIGVITPQSDPAIVSDFYAVMGDIMHQKGMEQEAFAAYDSCLVWKDDNIGCLNNYAYYLSLKGLELEKAEQMSYRTIKAEPKNATYLDTYAWILFMHKRYSEAKIYIDQTLQCDSDSSSVLLEHAGDIYFHTGDVDQAVVFWQEALSRADEQEDGERIRLLARKIKIKKYLKE